VLLCCYDVIIEYFVVVMFRCNAVFLPVVSAFDRPTLPSRRFICVIYVLDSDHAAFHKSTMSKKITNST
jgi:hypothetical protein